MTIALFRRLNSGTARVTVLAEQKLNAPVEVDQQDTPLGGVASSAALGIVHRHAFPVLADDLELLQLRGWTSCEAEISEAMMMPTPTAMIRSTSTVSTSTVTITSHARPAVVAAQAACR